MGITNVLDLLLHYPRRYADRSHPTAIADLVEGVEAMVVARVHSLVARAARGRRSVVELIAIDATGRLVIIFFNQPYRRDQLHEGDEVEIQVADERLFGVARKPGRQALIERLRAFRGRLPADFKFERDDANAR